MVDEGTRNLRSLLRHMSPELLPKTYYILSSVNHTIPKEPFTIEWKGREKEGDTFIVSVNEHESSAHFINELGRPWRMITLNIHSSLEAVGFLAAILPRLSAMQVPVNVISGYFHDHLLIPSSSSELVMTVLKEIIKENTLNE